MVSLCAMSQKPETLTVTNFTNFSYDNVEPAYAYDLVYPVNADILNADPNSYEPSYSERYFMSVFGPRHKEVSTSNIEYFDFHKGSDMTPVVSYGGVDYDDDNLPDIHCMCDGEIYQIFDDTEEVVEDTGTGRYVIVKCDQEFNGNPEWGNIYTAYRHLESIEAGLEVGDTLQKGDVVGVMGATGYTNANHLHFSLIRRNTGTQINVHPMRVFDPTAIPHLLNYLEDAEITQLDYSSNEALFRLAVPYNQANIRAITISLDGTNYEKTYDFEAISQLSEEDRDDNDAVEDLELFAYPFNRGQNAYRRVWDKIEDEKFTDVYPGNPDASDFYPFLSEGLMQTPAYVLDIKALNLPANFNIEDLKIEVIDIWGYGARAYGTTSTGHFAWSMIGTENDDAEEYESGTISLSSPDLDLVNDGGSKGDQTVGLLFRDLDIPQYATITNASVQFRCDGSQAGTATLTIHSEDNGLSADFSSSAHDLSNRATTYYSKNWSPSNWTIDDMNADQKVSGLEDIVQEVVTRNDWTANSPLVFLVTGTGKQEAEGYSGSNLWKNAYTYIEYTDDVATAPNEAPIVNISDPLNGATYSTLQNIDITANVSDINDNVEEVEFFVNGISVGTETSAPYTISYEIPDFGAYEIYAIATDTDGLSTQSATISINVADTVLEVQISGGNDDVEELENGTIWKTNSDLEMAYDSYVSGSQGLVGYQHVGLRFQNITIPQGATITSAYIQFTADEKDDELTTLTIWGEDTDDAAAFSYATNDVSNRTATSNSVEWIPEEWATVGAAGADEKTPDISTVIQEIVDRGAWNSGNSLVLVVAGEGTRTAESYDGSSADAPTLHLEYTSNSALVLPPDVINVEDEFEMQIDNLELTVFPNPVVDHVLNVAVFTKSEQTIELTLSNINGQVIANKNLQALEKSNTRFNLTGYPSGTYLLSAKLRGKIMKLEKVVIP